MKIRLINDTNLIAEIDKALEENNKKYGKRYCPCKLEHNDDNVCMCKEFREQKDGVCHCGKYEKVLDEE